MKSGKYIIVNTEGLEHPILFSDYMNHSDFLKMFDRDRIVSAGFFRTLIYTYETFDSGLEVRVSGCSMSLGLDVREKDARIIEEFLEGDII